MRKEMMRSKGFTLVEIMIVVAIIALLAAIAIPNLLTARRAANEAACKATLKSYATALETYAAALTGLYPALGASLVSDYFPYEIDTRTMGGYTYAAVDGSDLTVDGYTVTATSGGPNIGAFNFRVNTGAVLEQQPQAGGAWTTIP